MEKLSIILDRDSLKRILPHRGNALKIDEVYFNSDKPDEIVAIKHIDDDEPDLEGHFPHNPIYPGHCIDECFNLAAAVLILIKAGDNGDNNVGKLPVIRGKDFVKYSKMVRPGDTITFNVRLKQNRNNMIYVFDGKAINQNGKEAARIDGIKGVAVK